MSEPYNISLTDLIRSKLDEDRTGKCFICYEPGHMSYRCPHRYSGTRRCSRCMKWGHMKRCCPKTRCIKCNLLGHVGKDCNIGFWNQYQKEKSDLSKYGFGTNLYWYFMYRIIWKWSGLTYVCDQEIREEEEQWRILLGGRDPCVATKEENKVFENLNTIIY